MGGLGHNCQGGQQGSGPGLCRGQRWAVSGTSERLLCCMDSSLHQCCQLRLAKFEKRYMPHLCSGLLVSCHESVYSQMAAMQAA